MPGIVHHLAPPDLELGPHPADHLEHHPGAGLLEHGHRVTVGDTLQTVTIDCQQPDNDSDE